MVWGKFIYRKQFDVSVKIDLCNQANPSNAASLLGPYRAVSNLSNAASLLGPYRAVSNLSNAASLLGRVQPL